MPHTLLLADDSVTIQRVIELTFAEEDVQVVAVSDGDQAIQRLETAPPDIVLADIGMPGRNGYEVARYVRQSPHLSHIPVVLLTGAFEPVDQAKATEVGCDGVLAKPFEPQLVIGRVKELLASPGRRASFDAGDVAVMQPPMSAPDDDAASPQASTNLDEYFDRLDNAFANISTAPPPTQAAPPPVAEPLHEPAKEQAVPEPPARPAAPRAEVAEPAVRALPSVADAFAAILAAEQPGAQSPRPVWPVTSAPAASTAAIDEATIATIVERVLARIAVGDRVTEVAERLVREEIDRIKASIR